MKKRISTPVEVLKSDTVEVLSRNQRVAKERTVGRERQRARQLGSGLHLAGVVKEDGADRARNRDDSSTLNSRLLLPPTTTPFAL